MPERLTRRTFLHGSLTVICAPPVLAVAGCGPGQPAPTTTTIEGWEVPLAPKLAPQRFAVLAAAMDAMIPGSESSAGATVAHAAYYLDQLLGAFDVTPPRIFAGGPYSGRHGGLDGFSQFLPLTRVEELRWRTFLEGSQGLPEREWNGPVQGLNDRYAEGLDAVDALARSKHGARFTTLSLADRRNVLLAADSDFTQLLYQHAVEGTYGDPVYGGNLGLKGWAAIGYEGDRHPLGYTPEEMMHPEEMPG